MTEPNWGLITTGATFEALVSTLVSFEDPGARLFGRRGQDGGQDVRSGSHVYQAKHHVSASAAKAIADAKRELSKIRGHLVPGAERYEQWKDVKHWHLVTNAAFNPRDDERWNAEVVPGYQKLGLTADYWGSARLHALLVKHPEVRKSFFEGETRVFLTVPEFRETLPRDEHFLERSALTAFRGREPELARIRDFLSSEKRFLVIKGAGGVGKTRLIVEAGDMIASAGEWQVFRGNAASMEGSSAWLTGIVPERPTLLLLDEPEDPKLLERIEEQQRSTTGRMSQWKVALTTRSANDRLLKHFCSLPRRARYTMQLTVAPLPADAAEAMCSDLLESGALKLSDAQRQQIAADFARRFTGHPVWLTLAVDLLERRGDITGVPQEARTLASAYIEEIIKAQDQTPPDQVRCLLRWVAALGTADRHDREVLDLLCEQTGLRDRDELLSKLARLVDRRALTERGARARLLELKPDVLRDHVLQEWLTRDVGGGERRPSEAAKELVDRVYTAVQDSDARDLARRMLGALGRTQLLFRLAEQPVPLLDAFFTKLRGAVATMSASKRISLADLLGDVAVFDPLGTLSVLREMRRAQCAEETVEGFFSTKVYGHDDVLLALARPTSRAARRARTPEEKRAAFLELCALTEAEAEIATHRTGELPNDGGRAATLLKEVADGGRTFWGDYQEIATTEALRVLERVSRAVPSAGTQALLGALVTHAMHLDRTDEWSQEDSIHINQYVIGLSHPAWATRCQLLERTKQALESESTPPASRAALWHVLAKGHTTANQWARQGGSGPKDERERELSLKELGVACQQQVQGDLAWAYGVLTSRPCEIEELQAARTLWHWHVEFGPDSAEKEAAERLETFYIQNDLAAEFEPLFDPDDIVEARKPAQKASELVGDEREHAIEDFIQRGSRFVGGDAHLDRLARVMWCLGARAPESTGVRAFVSASLAQAAVSQRSDLGTETAASWVWAVRKQDPAAAGVLVAQLLASCGSNAQRAHLLLRLYSNIHAPPYQGKLHASEHALLRSSGPVFLGAQEGPAFVSALAFTLDHDWEVLRPLLESTLDNLPSDQLSEGVQRLVRATTWKIQNTDQSVWPGDLLQWLFDQILRLPTLAELAESNGSRCLGQIVGKLGRLSVPWLASALRRCAERERQSPRRISAYASDMRMSRYVSRVQKTEPVPEETVSAIESLLDLTDDLSDVGQTLPEVLRDVDPEGVLVPARVAARVGKAETLDDLHPLAKLATAYALGTEPWRVIVRACFMQATQIGIDPEPIFQEVSRQQSHWMSARGEVPAFFRVEVERARHSLGAEQDWVFQPFWQWRIACAEDALRGAEERAK